MPPLKPASRRLAMTAVPRPGRCEAPTTAIAFGWSNDAMEVVASPGSIKRSLPQPRALALSLRHHAPRSKRWHGDCYAVGGQEEQDVAPQAWAGDRAGAARRA